MPNSPDYPEALELAWRQHAMQVTRVGESRLAVERLEGAAGSLSEAFTTGRDPGFAGYSQDRRALAAYGVFFFPRAYTRTRIVLRECRARAPWQPAPSTLHVVDLGAGTGAAGLAALQELSAWYPETPIHLELVDTAAEGINLSRTIHTAGHHLWPSASITEIRHDARTFASNRPADVILCSFAVNEWMEQQPDFPLADWTARQLTRLKPGGWLIILEPALRFTVERMERLRDTVAANKLAHIIAPCPHHAPCPMLAEKRGWCHEVRNWKPPESLRWINRRLQRDVHLLKFSFLALTNQPVEPANGMRLVSPVDKQKGKYVVHACAPDGRVRTCEWLTRHLEENGKAQSEQLERGDLVDPAAGKPLGDGRTERLPGPPPPAQSR